MNRRTFLRGLAATTALAAAGVPALPAPPALPSAPLALGQGGYVGWRAFHRAVALNDSWMTRLDAADRVLRLNRVKPLPDGTYFAMTQPTCEDDRRLYGVSFQRLPGGEWIDPRDVYLSVDQMREPRPTADSRLPVYPWEVDDLEAVGTDRSRMIVLAGEVTT